VGESFLRYNLTFCDGILICEVGRSFDNTTDIIQSLINEGLAIHWADIDRNELERLASHNDVRPPLAQIAIDKFGADLVLPLDADEFLYHTGGMNPRDTLEALREDVEYQVLWRTYVYQEEPDYKHFMPDNFTHYRNPVLEHHRKALAHKRLFVDKGAAYTAGAHALSYPEDHKGATAIEYPPGLLYAHFPLRSKPQLMTKVILNHIRKWSDPSIIKRGEGFQLGKIYAHLKEHGQISADDMTRQSIEYGVTDNRLRETLSKAEGQILIEGRMDVSFCADKLGLRYTDYRLYKDVFLKAMLIEVESTLKLLSSKIEEKDESARQNDELTPQIDILLQQIRALTVQSDALTQQIADIYDSKTWKTGKLLQRVFRFFVPPKQNT